MLTMVVWQGSRKLGFSGGYNVPLEANPFVSELKVLDCGDIPVTSYVSYLSKIFLTVLTGLDTTMLGPSSRLKKDITAC
jgi:hypothetical protein